VLSGPPSPFKKRCHGERTATKSGEPSPTQLAGTCGMCDAYTLPIRALDRLQRGVLAADERQLFRAGPPLELLLAAQRFIDVRIRLGVDQVGHVVAPCECAARAVLVGVPAVAQIAGYANVEHGAVPVAHDVDVVRAGHGLGRACSCFAGWYDPVDL